MILTGNHAEARAAQRGFTLVEATIGAALAGILIAALCGGITYAISLARLNSENLRATQILTEKMDLIRACTWMQITNGYAFIPSTFSAPFSNSGTNGGGLIYQGAVTIAIPSATESYRQNLREVTLTVTWTSAHQLRSRSMTTFVSPYGIQDFTR